MSNASRRRTKVLWLAKGLGLGGMEQLLVTHARVGDRDRFEYSAAYLVDRPHSVLPDLADLGVPTVRLGGGTGRDQRWVKDLVRLVRREDIDVVHAHSPAPAALARPAVRAMRGVGMVYTEHNSWDRFERVTQWANRSTYGWNDASFAVSEDCRASMSSSARSRTETLIHGVDAGAVAATADRVGVRSELGIADEDVVVGIVANLRRQKNYELLLDVAADLTGGQRRVVFVSVGQGPLEDQLRLRHEQLGLGDRFRFLGFRRDAQRVMSAFDIFCLSSIHEGLPVALMEAKAFGLPVVATAVGGIPSAVVDGAEGVLVRSGDREALRGALAQLVDDPSRRAELAAASRASADRFDASLAVARLERAYEDVHARRVRHR